MVMLYINFLHRIVSEKEERCSKNCLDKFLKMSQRLAIRFQEHQQAIMADTSSSDKPSPLIS